MRWGLRGVQEHLNNFVNSKDDAESLGDLVCSRSTGVSYLVGVRSGWGLGRRGES